MEKNCRLTRSWVKTLPIITLSAAQRWFIRLLPNKHIELVSLLGLACFCCNSALADYAVSDLLIVLDDDGRSHTVQHTVASGGPRITLTLPGSIIPQEVMFFGANRDQQQEQLQSNPKHIEVENGTAFARYQHQYGDSVQQADAGLYTLTTPSVPDTIEANAPLSQSGITWVFPIELDIVSYTVTDPAVGRWISANNTLTYHQLGNSPVTLSIQYRSKSFADQSSEPLCSDIAPPSDACSEDSDEDGVPDYRDICIADIGDPSNSLGCPPEQSIVLSDIVFDTGRTYLDVSARNQLDRVAYALLRTDDSYYEIGAHTDNVGGSESNRALSQKRADAVRHYLMLRGIHPNALVAQGYGEQYPVRDNASQDGKRANRRVELVNISR